MIANKLTPGKLYLTTRRCSLYADVYFNADCRQWEYSQKSLDVLPDVPVLIVYVAGWIAIALINEQTVRVDHGYLDELI